MNPDLSIKPLSEESLEDYLSFFESVRFTDNPHWSDCYCYSFHFTGSADQWIREKNKAAVVRLVSEGKMKGYLAYARGNVIGWCNVNERRNFQRLSKIYELPESDSLLICSVVCFLIHQDYRRQGITTHLLHRIEADYAARGYVYIEAYPSKNEPSCEALYKGPLDLYKKNGFSVIREKEDYLVVRKTL